MAATKAKSSIRLVAYFEAFKGMLVLISATGLLTLVHHDLQHMAARLIAHAHLNPAAKYPHIFLDAVTQLQDSRLVLLALGAAAYSAVRLVEAYGLYHDKAWAEVLAAASGGIYLPVELYQWFKRPTTFHAALFIVNAVVVGLMLYALMQRRRDPPQL